MALKREFVKLISKTTLKPLGYKAIKEHQDYDFYLHEYKSYEEYRDVQIHFNKQKIVWVWADEKTLDRLIKIILDEFPKNSEIHGLCHGTRNGFEQNYLRTTSDKIQAIGTDISETAHDYENSVQWDFHDVREDWIGSMDFVYTNSLDQSWQPKVALETWLGQLNRNGILVIEHTNEGHGPIGASEMDPFGVRPTVLPYVLTMWFGAQITIEHSVDKKENNGIEAWLFVIRKNVNEVKLL